MCVGFGILKRIAIFQQSQNQIACGPPRPKGRGMLRGRTPGFLDFRNFRVFVAQISLISTIETLRSVSSEHSPKFYRFKRTRKTGEGSLHPVSDLSSLTPVNSKS